MTRRFVRYDLEADFALRAVSTAGRLVRQIQREMVVPALIKDDRSPVTVADFASQAVVAQMFERAFPGETLVAEEDSGALQEPGQGKTLEAVTGYVARLLPSASPERVCRWIDLGAGEPADRFWTLDPIDGTKGFLRREQYVVALALVEEGQVVVGALGCPELAPDMRPDVGGAGSVVVAVRGEGAWVEGLDGGARRRLRVSKRDDPATARILRSAEAGHTDAEKIDELAEALGTVQPPALMDSQAKFCVLAGGHGDLIFRLLSPQRPNYCEKIWDQAAGSLVVEEAGGRVSDLRGAPLDFSLGRELENNLGVLVSNGRVHDAALAALEAVGADRRPAIGER